MAIEVVPFTDDHLEEAARMVAARYQAERSLEQSLPVRFESPEAIMPLMHKVTERGPGVAAIRDGGLVGFLLTHLSLFREARSAYTPDCGHAAEAVGRRDIYRSMYASLSRVWLAHGCFDHGITLLAHEREALDAWFSLGFGLTVIDVLRDVRPVRGPAAAIDIRRATPKDVDLVATLEIALRRYLAMAPIFIPLVVDEGRASRQRWLSDPGKSLWLAFRADEPVAYVCLEPSRCEVMPIADEGTVAITGAFTKERLRGRGIGTALLNRALEWASSAGYQHCSVDFESANIPGSRFWLGRGFQPVCYSLTRRVDDRLAWANEDRGHADLIRAYEGRIGVG